MTTAEHTPFSAARRGYDRTQVDAQLDVLSAQLRAATSARHSALAQVEALSRKLEAGIGDIQSARAVSTQHRAEADELRGQVAALSTIPHTVDGMSERLQQMTRIAQDEVNDMRRRATTSAAHVLTRAQAEADKLRERSDAERHEFETEWRTAQEELRSPRSLTTRPRSARTEAGSSPPPPSRPGPSSPTRARSRSAPEPRPAIRSRRPSGSWTSCARCSTRSPHSSPPCEPSWTGHFPRCPTQAAVVPPRSTRRADFQQCRQQRRDPYTPIAVAFDSSTCSGCSAPTSPAFCPSC